MRKAFTLVEMLIVVVVLVTLMTITFRLGAINQSSWQRNTTVTRLQRLENCLSGYYAAFGSYPPVATLNSRNPFIKVDEWGMQPPDGEDGEEDPNIFGWNPDTFRKGVAQEEEAKAWAQVQAACKAQPVGCSYPFPDEYGDIVLAWSDHLKGEVATTKSLSEAKRQIFSAGFDAGSGANIGRFSTYKDKTDWRDLQLFKFGLMSYLLPRFLMMMNADESFYDFGQWTGNNSMPSDPLTGQKFNDWYDVKRKSNDKQNKTDYARVANIPSQAVCARWMPNLEGIVFTPHDSLSAFGLSLADKSFNNEFSFSTEVYSPGKYGSRSSGAQYVLDSCTVVDGWKNDFYYYSPAPYQTYILWSAGPNGRTFPPWISRDGLDSSANRCVSAWIEDDIVNMSH